MFWAITVRVEFLLLFFPLHNTETETAQGYRARTTVSDDETCMIQTISNSATVLIFSINPSCPRTTAEIYHCFVKESQGTAIKVIYVRMKERNVYLYPLTWFTKYCFSTVSVQLI